MRNKRDAVRVAERHKIGTYLPHMHRPTHFFTAPGNVKRGGAAFMCAKSLRCTQANWAFSMRELAELMLMNEDEVKSKFALPKNRLKRIV